MRSLYGAGKPRAAHECVLELFFAFLALMKAFDALWVSQSANFDDHDRDFVVTSTSLGFLTDLEKRRV